MAAFAVMASYSGAALLDVPTLQWLCSEDRPVEDLGAMLFFLAAVAFAVCARRVASDPRNVGAGWLSIIPAVVLAAGMLWIALEEISYGQRIVGFGTPVLVQSLNTQREFNLHNLRFWSREDGLWHWLNVQRWFSLFWLAYCTIFPLARRLVPSSDAWTRAMYVPVAPVGLGLLFVLNYAMAKVMLLAVFPPDLTSAITEMKETNYGMLFATFGLIEWARLRNGHGAIPTSRRGAQGAEA